MLMFAPTILVRLALLALRGSDVAMLLILPAFLATPAFIIGVVMVVLGWRERRKTAVSSQNLSDLPPPRAGSAVSTPTPQKSNGRRIAGDVLAVLGAVCLAFALLAVAELATGDSSPEDALSDLAAFISMLFFGVPGLVMLVVGLLLRRRR